MKDFVQEDLYFKTCIQETKKFKVSSLCSIQKMKNKLPIIQDEYIQKHMFYCYKKDLKKQQKSSIFLISEPLILYFSTISNQIQVLLIKDQIIMMKHKEITIWLSQVQVKRKFIYLIIIGVLQIQLGNLYIQLGLNDHAMDDLNQCIELNPNFASAYIEKGLLLKDKEKAKLNLEKAIKLSPNNPYYLTCLGIFYNNNFNEDEAILNLKKANTLWSEKGLPYLKKNFVLTQKEIAFIQSNLQKFERLIRNERRRSQSQQSLQDVVYAQQKEIVELQNEVKYLKVEQKKIKKSLTPMQKDIDNLKKVQIIHRDILEKKILIKQNWERLKAQGNECERIYCECLFWKLSSYIHACIQANTQFFQINPQEINPSSNSFSQFFVEASIALLKIIGFVPSIGAIAGLIGEAIQEISEKHKKSTFKEKLQKIALVAQKSAADDLDEQIQLATFQMGNQLIERQFKQWKTKKQKYYKYVEKIAQLEKNNGKLEASRLEYMQALEDSLYILSYIVEESKAFLENDKCFSEIIVYIFKTHIYKS